MEYLQGNAAKEAEKWMHEAARVASRALCLKAKCGTVIVKDGEIIGEGYNAPPLDKEEHRMCDRQYGPGKPLYDQTCCMHAEWRAILDAAKRHPDRLQGSTLYFVRVDTAGEIKKAGKPYCTVCSRFALDSGISEFVLWHEEGVVSYPTGEYDRLSYEYTPESVTQ